MAGLMRAFTLFSSISLVLCGTLNIRAQQAGGGTNLVIGSQNNNDATRPTSANSPSPILGGPSQKAKDGSRLIFRPPHDIPNSTISDITSSSVPSAAVDGAMPVCDGSLYGTNLKHSSCAVLVHQMPDNLELKRFGQRGKGAWDHNLPYRILSRKHVFFLCQEQEQSITLCDDFISNMVV